MRELADAARIRRLMEALGAAAPADGRAYLIGGATAILLGWRGSTIDVDLKFVPEQDAVFRAILALKEELRVNVELAAKRSSADEGRPPLAGCSPHLLHLVSRPSPASRANWTSASGIA